MNIKHFFDPDTSTLTYVVFDESTKDAVVIDPVMDYDPASGKTSEKSSMEVIQFLKAQGLKLHAILETHAHADHISGSQIIKRIFPQAKIAIGRKITIVQEVFIKHFNLDFIQPDGRQFDQLIQDGEELSFGSLKMKAMATPGHTPADMSYLFGDNLFTGDCLFMPDYGTGRCDFPKGSAKDLYHSVKRLYQLPDATKVYVGHDYQPDGRELMFQTTIGESKLNNIQLKSQTSEADYIKFRETRDATLKAPRLLLPSIQVNIDAGRLPPAEKNGMAYLKLPISGEAK